MKFLLLEKRVSVAGDNEKRHRECPHKQREQEQSDYNRERSSCSLVHPASIADSARARKNPATIGGVHCFRLAHAAMTAS